MSYKFILSNPYIVGNPIKSKEMFFGREEDFKFIKEKLQQETKGIIITLAGERRSGKTSILFQIMNGRLGYDFLPFFIDMQTMADVNSNREFFHKIDDCLRKELYMPQRELDFEGEGFKDFEIAISNIQKNQSWKKLILLFDEYELLENKTEKGQISEDVFMFFANLMENHNVLFVFSGSNKIRDRNPVYWKALFSKSIYRNISFLDKKDCAALITKPCEGYVTYNPEYVKLIYRITAGQPFYTQIFCQNMVDWLKNEQRNEVMRDDLYKVIQDIIDHPIPQMIYFWNELTRNQKLLLAIIAEIIQFGDSYTDSSEIIEYLGSHQLSYLLTLNEINGTFEELYHLEILTKTANVYQFRVDLFRYWIKQDQTIWKVINDYKSELIPPALPIKKKGMLISLIAVFALITIAITIGIIFKRELIPVSPQTEHIFDTLFVKSSENTVVPVEKPMSKFDVAWWDKGSFRNTSGKSDQLSNLAFDVIIPTLAKYSNLQYAAHEQTAGMNSENFAKLIYKKICRNYSQPWNRKTIYSNTTKLESGNLLVFTKGGHLFYFDGWDQSSMSNKKIAIGMTTKGIHAVSFSFDSILYVKSIQLDEYNTHEQPKLIKNAAVQTSKNILNELGLLRTEDFRKILSSLLEYQSPAENEQVLVNSYKDDPQGFVAFIFSKAYNLKIPDSSQALSQSNLQKWLKGNRIHMNSIENDYAFKTGDLVFYSIDGKEHTMFYLKSKDGLYVIGMTELGVKQFRFNFSPYTGGVDINYFWSRP